MAAFFRATFDAWKGYRRTGQQEVYVGYSPIIVVDADKILTALPRAHVLHVVRSGYRKGERVIRPAQVIIAGGPS